uniref:NAC transcription factor 44 n=1 Tax=Litchi chinensis TaxID=151069 RepID=A0A8K1HZM1_LITCN|nr:NAC transcription factor 44 [Litchi chinensis]
MENNNVTRSSNNAGLPVGFRFDPTDNKLLVNYLFKKVHGNPLPSPTSIIDCDVYGGGRAWKRLFEESEEDNLYFFTRLKKKHENGKSMEWGTWRGQNGKEIYGYNGDQKVKIGGKRSFSFIPKNGVQEMRDRWVMHEYRLDGCLLDDQNNNSWCTWFAGSSIRRANEQGMRETMMIDDNGAAGGVKKCVAKSIQPIKATARKFHQHFRVRIHRFTFSFSLNVVCVR